MPLGGGSVNPAPDSSRPGVVTIHPCPSSRPTTSAEWFRISSARRTPTGSVGRPPASWRSPELVIGRDARSSSPALCEALVRGVTDEGVEVVDIGMVATPMLYFAVDRLGAGGGIMLTASHNPAEYNGFKICRENAIPIGEASGLKEIEREYERLEPAAGEATPARDGESTPRGDSPGGRGGGLRRARSLRRRGPSLSPRRHRLRERHGVGGALSAARSPRSRGRAALLRSGLHLSQPPRGPAQGRESRRRSGGRETLGRRLRRRFRRGRRSRHLRGRARRADPL